MLSCTRTCVFPSRDYSDTYCLAKLPSCLQAPFWDYKKILCLFWLLCVSGVTPAQTLVLNPCLVFWITDVPLVSPPTVPTSIFPFYAHSPIPNPCKLIFKQSSHHSSSLPHLLFSSTLWASAFPATLPPVSSTCLVHFSQLLQLLPNPVSLKPPPSVLQVFISWLFDQRKCVSIK